MCLHCCGIDAHVRDGKFLHVTGMKEHPFNKLCVKARAIPSLPYSDERITEPMRKVHGIWRRVSWDEAFDIVATKLMSIRKDYGAKALVTHIGEPLIATQVGQVVSRFCSLYGTPNFTTGGSLCFSARAIGHGLSLNNRMMPLYPSYDSTACMVIWGHNPIAAHANEAYMISEARQRGVRLIVMDPRKIELAKRADLYVCVRPGTDCALALGLINVIIAEELYDKAFVKDWTIGFEELREHVKRYSPEEVERITWVSAEDIRALARIYSTSKPATISQGESLDHSINGVQASRAISVLVAITGNLDVIGGNIYNLPLPQSSLRVKGRVAVEEAIGAKYPIYGRFTSETTSMPVPDAILTGSPYPIKALILQASNPLLTWPNSNKVKRALEKLELLVVSDLLMTETSQLADILLPVHSFLEKEFLKEYSFEGLPLITVSNRVVEPLYDCLEDWQIWSELGKRMGYSEYFSWQNNDELLTKLLEPSAVTLEQLRLNPGGILYRDLSRQQKYREEGLNTPSGKVEIFSQTMADHGYAPLPTYTEPADNAADNSKLANDYPFILITGSRVSAFTHSQYRNMAELRRLIPQPKVEINLRAAQALDIGDGDQVVIESPRGSIKLSATITEDIHPLVLSLQHGWNEANANILTDDQACDPISGYPAFKSVACRVRKVE